MPASHTASSKSGRQAAAFMSMCRKAGHSRFCMLGVFGSHATGAKAG